MQLDEYKNICAQPNVFRCSDLQETLTILKKATIAQLLCVALEHALSHSVLDKPLLHSGSNFAHTDWVVLNLSREQVDDVVNHLGLAEANSLLPDGSGGWADNYFSAFGKRLGRLSEQF